MLKLLIQPKLTFFFIITLISCSLETSSSGEDDVLFTSFPNQKVKSIYVQCNENEFNSIYKNFKENENSNI